MAYFIFLNLNNTEGTLHKIAENENDLNSLNIIKSDYKIIEDTQENFNAVKFGTKEVLKFNNNLITYTDIITKFENKELLKSYIQNIKNHINSFKPNNLNNPFFSVCDNYLNQLNSLNLDNITYPLNKSLEKHFDDLGQTSINPLQVP